MTDIAADDDGEPEGGEQYSIAIFFPGGGYIYAARWIDGEAAVRQFRTICESVPARAGVYARVIITDGGDFTNCEWKHGEGYTYPPELVRFNGPAT